MKPILALLLTSWQLLVFSQSNILYFNPLQNTCPTNLPQRQLEDHGLQGIDVHWSFCSARMLNKYRGEELYQLIKIAGFSHMQEPGLPALPSHIDWVAVPKGASYRLENIRYKSRYKKGFHLYPALKPAVDTEGAPEPPFEINEEFYRQNRYFPSSPVRIIDSVKIRGMVFLLIEVSPIRYNPAKGRLQTIEQLSYTVSFHKATRFIDYENHSDEYLHTLLDIPLNTNGFRHDYARYQSRKQGAKQSRVITTSYLIITRNDLKAAADSLAYWKRQTGYGVEVISASQWTASAVKSTIHSRYQALSPKPDYYVILGDIQQVPTEMFTSPSGDPFGSDLYYACMDGGNDYVPDIGRGRISVSSPAEAMTVVQKIINYERHPLQDSSFYQNGVNCAQYQDDNHDSYADRRFLHTSEEVHNYLLGRGYDIQRIYYAGSGVIPYNYNSGYYSNGQQLPSDLLPGSGFNWYGNGLHIRDAINAGKFYVLHRDHGYSGGLGWAHPYFVTSSINSLTNQNKLPVVFSINCHTGEFTLSNCFAEKFLRYSNGGAVGVVAASYYSYSGYNDGFTIGMFDGIWSNPGLLPAFGSGGVSNPSTSTHSDIVAMGYVMDHGLIRMTQTWGGNNSGRQYTYKLFHWFGDPSMRIPTAFPDSLNASHPMTLNCGDTALSISNVNDSLVTATLTSHGILLGKTRITNGSGSIPINFMVGNKLTLTLTARNRTPYIAEIMINPGGYLSVYPLIKNSGCFGDSTGEITLIPACGYPPYQISWDKGDTSATISGLARGYYRVSITDTANNILVDSFFVWGATSPLQANPQVHDARCYFESSGSVQLNLSGGCPPYFYHWSNGSHAPSATNLPAGNYSVQVEDSVGCDFSASFSINQPPPINLQTVYSDDTTGTCSGTGTAIASGGVPPYTYLWNDPAQQTTPSATGLCAGLYKVSLTDSNLCTQYRSIYILNTSGIDEKHDFDVEIFPNPARSQLTLVFATNQDIPKSIKLYSASGKMLQSIEIKQNNKTITLPLGQYEQGIYYIMFNVNNITFTKKIVIFK